MNIYVIYKDGIVVSVSTLPRVVQDEFSRGSDIVEVWRKEKRVKTLKSAREFNRFVNPPMHEDEEVISGGNYEW